MQVEREIIESWLEDKLGGSRRRLRAPGAAEFTYQGPQWGHPSNFAAVKMRSDPPMRSLSGPSPWRRPLSPKRISRRSSRRFAAGSSTRFLPLITQLGMSVTLTEIGWDDVMSSEVAFARAARGAAGKLIAEGEWDFIPRRA
jgi:hypothetical protein